MKVGTAVKIIKYNNIITAFPAGAIGKIVEVGPMYPYLVRVTNPIGNGLEDLWCKEEEIRGFNNQLFLW